MYMYHIIKKTRYTFVDGRFLDLLEFLHLLEISFHICGNFTFVFHGFNIEVMALMFSSIKMRTCLSYTK